MYIGNTVPTEWPKRADRATYEYYGSLPSLLVEEATALIAGYAPREKRFLKFHPNHSVPRAPAPYIGAKTWGQLINTEIGDVISSLARYRRVDEWDFTGADLHITPSELLEFCDRCHYAIPQYFREAVQSSIKPVAETTRSTGATSAPSSKVPSTPKEPEATYLRHTRQVVNELQAANVRVTVSDLQTFVEREFTLSQRTIVSRTFQDYLSRWRRTTPASDPFAGFLARVLLDSGRPGDEYVAQLKERLPKKFTQVFKPAGRPQKQLRK